MKILVVGAGNIGGTLVRAWAAGGHEVLVANSRGRQSLRALARESGAEAVALGDLPADVAVAVLAVPRSAAGPRLAAALAALPAATIVVDATNYVPGLRDPAEPEVDAGEPESVWLRQRLGRPVVKAFNTVAAASLRQRPRDRGHPERVAVPVSGDDDPAKAVVIGLLDELGFDGFDAGPLAESWRQQPGTPVYTADLPLAAAREAVASARADQSARWRERVSSLPRP